MSAVVATEPDAEALLRITLGALNARPRFRLGHVGDRAAIRDSYELASAIERWLASRPQEAGGPGSLRVTRMA